MSCSHHSVLISVKPSPPFVIASSRDRTPVPVNPTNVGERRGGNAFGFLKRNPSVLCTDCMVRRVVEGGDRSQINRFWRGVRVAPHPFPCSPLACSAALGDTRDTPPRLRASYWQGVSIQVSYRLRIVLYRYCTVSQSIRSCTTHDLLFTVLTGLHH
jgi:hypothetical protein